MSDLRAFNGRVVDEPARDQFAFWVGEWDVTSRAGEEVTGHNSIRWVLDGAVLQEDFTAGENAFTGRTSRSRWAAAGCRPGWITPVPTSTSREGRVGDRMVLASR